MTQDVFRQLQERLDQYSMGFPATDSGVEMEILKELFSVEDAQTFLQLTPRPETPEAVAERCGASVDTVAAHLDDMAERGLLFRLRKGGVSTYGAIPFVHGLFEFQVATLTPRLAGLVQRYMDEAFNGAITRGAAAFLRTVPIQRTLQVMHHVAAYEDAAQILRTAGKVVVTDCICRKQKRLVGQGCDAPLEVCFMFGSMGQYYVDRGMGREISTDEALQILTTAQDAGLVTQPATAQNPGGMCNCCGDCCGVLTSLKRHPRPADKVFSNYFAAVTRGVCTGCETCVDRCQMDAIQMGPDGEAAEILRERCIGCGLCVAACPEGALELVLKPEGERREPPATGFEQMAFMADIRRAA